MRALGTALALLVLGGFSSCAELMALRGDDGSQQASYDSQDSGTSGGRWADRGLLDRGPAGAGDGQNDRWIDPTRADQNRYDQARGDELAAENDVNYSNMPNNPPANKRQYKGGNRATRADFIDDAANEGSLWGSDGQTNYYFTKNKVRAVGDIVSIVTEAGLVKDIGQEVRRTLTDSEKSTEIDQAQARMAAKGAAPAAGAAGATGAAGAANTDAVNTSQAAPSAASPAAGAAGGGLFSPTATEADIDVTKSLDIKAGDNIMAEIVERYPNGNYKVRGTKKLIYKNGSPRLLNITGVVKGSDIADDDTVSSGKLYEYRLEAIR